VTWLCLQGVCVYVKDGLQEVPKGDKW
jgi:hypothetical protein